MFNLGAFFVLFREALEASIILTVLLRYIDATPLTDWARKRLRRQVWIGSLIGLVISVALGVTFTLVFYLLKHDVLGDNLPLFEGILLLVAVILLTWLAFKMLSINEMYSKWQSKISKATKDVDLSSDSKPSIENEPSADSADTSLTSFSKYGFVMLTFSIIMREGLESVIFIAGIGGGDPQSLLVPGLVGILVGSIVGFIIFKSSGKLNLRLFMIISTVVLLIIASGLATNAAAELEEYIFRKAVNRNVEGVGIEDEGDEIYSKEVGGFEDIPESTPIVWDLSDCCNEKRVYFFQVMYTLVGWKSKPTVVTTLVYILYWIGVSIAFFIKRFKARLLRKKEGAAAAKKSTEDLKRQSGTESTLHRSSISSSSSSLNREFP